MSRLTGFNRFQEIWLDPTRATRRQARVLSVMVLGIAAGGLLELYCIWSYFFSKHYMLDAALSLVASVLICSVVILGLFVMRPHRATVFFALLAALMYASYKGLNFYFTYQQSHSTRYSDFINKYDDLILNSFLWTGVVALLTCMLAALRESRTARYALQRKNDALEAEVAQRREYQRELEDNRERFLQITDQTREIIWEVDADGLYTHVSRAITPVTGYLPEDLIGKVYFYDLHPEVKREAFKQSTLEQMKNREIFVDFPSNVLTRNGSVIEITTNGIPVVNEEGLLLGYRGSSRDVTEARTAVERERLLSTAIENAAESIVITDRAGTILYVNAAFAALTGYSKDEVAGHTPRLLKSGRHNSAYYGDLWATLLRGEVWRGNFINKRKDGSLFEEAATISPILSPVGKITHFVAVKRDVTRERHLERQLRQAAKLEAAGTLASGIVHNLNSVLALVAGHAEVAHDQLPADHPARASMEVILRSGYGASRLLKRLLAFSRQQPQPAEPVQAAPLVQDALALLSAQLPPSIIFESSISECAGMILADPGDVQQVVVNLCTNAIAAMPQGGQLEFRLEPSKPDPAITPCVGAFRDGEYVLLRVRDTGIGLVPGDHERIFEPFYTSNASNEGHGLGLATVANIVHSWQAAIAVESAPGNGTTFDIYIPRFGGPEATGEPR